MAQSTRFIYKILPNTPRLPDPIPESLPTSDLDKSSGFIHMSTAAQVPNTLKFFFATSTESRDSVYLLRVPLQPLEDAGKIRWEDPKAQVCGARDGEGMFPHIYDGKVYKLGRDEVESWREVVSEAGTGNWEAGLQGVREWMV